MYFISNWHVQAELACTQKTCLSLLISVPLSVLLSVDHRCRFSSKVQELTKQNNYYQAQFKQGFNYMYNVRINSSNIKVMARTSVWLCGFVMNRFVVSCIPTWFWGPMVTLEDCLAAFFAADELKGRKWPVLLCSNSAVWWELFYNRLWRLSFPGDNMYSCERCKK